MIRGDQYQGPLKIGQKVYSALYGGRNGIIYEIQGEQMPETIETLGNGVVVMGGYAHIGIVFDDHKTVIPEAIIRGVQWYISDDVVSPDDVKDALTLQGILSATQKREKQELEVERERLRLSLIEKYPYLIPRNKTVSLSSHALGAKNMKKQLSVVFPNVEFSVKSKSYTGGSSITVRWIDGPTKDEVESVVSLYEKGRFNGMYDIYEYYKDTVWPSVFGGAEHVFTDRQYSDNAILEVLMETWKRYNLNEPVPGVEDYREGKLWNWYTNTLNLNEVVTMSLDKKKY